MRRRGASEFRAGLRAARAVYRAVNDSRRRLPLKLSEGRRSVGEERAHAEQRPPSRFARTLSPDPLTGAPVTEHLYARLEPGDVAAVEGALQPAEAALWETADAADRKRLTLAFAAHRRLEPARSSARACRAAMPTGDVHSMAHGPAAAGGSTYYADLVADSLTQAGLDLSAGMAGLDFGCSSGRVVRVLAAAYPELDWHGCDPIPDAIEWAREHLPGISFERSPEYPPLPYDDGQFDFAFAISIWSHFAEGAALDWLREMHRVVRPGGRLLITTHGEQTLAHTWREGVRSLEQLKEIQAAWTSTASGTPPSSARPATTAWPTLTGARPFSAPEWLLAKLTPAVERGPVPAGPGRGQPGPVRARAPLAMAGRLSRRSGQGRRAVAARARWRPCAPRASSSCW